VIARTLTLGSATTSPAVKEQSRPVPHPRGIFICPFSSFGNGGPSLLSLSFFFGISPSATAAAAVFGTRVTPTLLATDPFQPHPAGELPSRVPCRWGPRKFSLVRDAATSTKMSSKEGRKSLAVGGAERCKRPVVSGEELRTKQMPIHIRPLASGHPNGCHQQGPELLRVPPPFLLRATRPIQ